mmetsp:Transcript_72737/g.229128  ORF Transcript_72737/g.229128 Transcript_72737/m.229128 type:complete len:424 (+) Transcript_72737:90-1361(+)
MSRGPPEPEPLPMAKKGSSGIISDIRTIPPHLWVIYGNVTLYALCYMAQAPVLPYLTKSLGADLSAYGRLMTGFSVVQFVGGLLAGPMIDVFGGKVVFAASFWASALCYALTGMSSNMTLLYFSRIPTLIQHAVMAARAVVTDHSAPEDRARFLGYIGVAYGLGFAIGPAMGGWMAQHSLQATAWAATIGSIASALMVQLFLPAHVPKPAVAAGPSLWSRMSPKEFSRVCQLPQVPSLLCVKTLTGLAAALFHSVFNVMLDEKFHLGARANGLIMSYAGVLSVAVQATVIGFVTARYTDSTIIKACTAASCLSYVALSMVGNVNQLLVVLIPLTAASLVLATVNTAQLTKAAPQESGTIIAIDMSVGSGVRIISPGASVWLWQRAGHGSIGGAGAALTALLLVLVQADIVSAKTPVVVAPKAM